MNSLYLLVEGGQTEPALYSAWLPLILKGTRRLARPEEASSSRGFYILAGYGYPSLLNRISNAVEDLAAFPGFARLMVALDCEDRHISEATDEVTQAITDRQCPVPASVVVADCCIETWLLGNRKFVKRNPVTDKLRQFRDEYDVTRLDPELMPNARPTKFNSRAQYHKAYLRAAYNEHGLKFTEARPREAVEWHFLKALIERSEMDVDPRHLGTFATMIAVLAEMQELGSADSSTTTSVNELMSGPKASS